MPHAPARPRIAIAQVRMHWTIEDNLAAIASAMRLAHRQGAAVLVCLRNLANGLYELERHRGHTQVDTFNSWCEQQTFTSVWPLLKR